jgi:hypothetical protein
VAVVGGGGAGAPVAAHADAEHADPPRVDLGQRGQMVDVAADGALVVAEIHRQAARAGFALAGALHATLADYDAAALDSAAEALDRLSAIYDQL